MPECERLDDCAIYRDAMVTMPTIAHLYRDRYCAANHFACARFRAFEQLGKGNVPADLLPTDHARLKDILA